jgi:hypothetical protein
LYLIITRKNFSLCMYLTSVLRLYSLIISVSIQMCALDTIIEMTVSKWGNWIRL